MKICHIRGRENYWKDLLLVEKDFSHQVYGTVLPKIKTWNETFNINYKDFRYQLRKIVLNNIKQSNIFDIICNNDEEFYHLLNSLPRYKNIVIYQQDDDDLFLKNNFFIPTQTESVTRFKPIALPIGSRDLQITEKIKKDKIVSYLHTNNYLLNTTPDFFSFRPFTVIPKPYSHNWVTQNVYQRYYSVHNNYTASLGLYIQHLSSLSILSNKTEEYIIKKKQKMQKFIKTYNNTTYSGFFNKHKDAKSAFKKMCQLYLEL
tara:strand:+ start:770 stop:1549 length:780 start_codon:yes stop_codon:yes gene_type:complete